MKLGAVLHYLRISAHALWIGARDPLVFLPVRLFGAFVAAYAFSPIDLIPDFIPILGLLDDLILVPLGVWLFLKMVPADLHARHRAEAEAASERPTSLWGAGAIILIWIMAAIWLGVTLWTMRFY